jgi:uncharacterized membrane protein YphA (DoxX/SURF4 family)
MLLVRRIARPMLASVFISGGIDSLRDPELGAEAAGDVATDVADAAPPSASLPSDPLALVRIDAGVKIVGGLLLAGGGRFARLGAVALAASLVPTTLGAHRFWEVDGAEERLQQQLHFTKNLSLFGGLLLAAVDTGGRPSVGWRARRAAGEVRERATAILPSHH